jgi:hypothetical protein
VTDYYAQVFGQYTSDIAWSFGLHITSSQAEATLLTTWENAWNSAWNDGTHGLKVLYPTTTEITGYTVATLDASYQQTTKSRVASTQAGTATGDSLPYLNAIVVSLRSNSVVRGGRGRFYLPATEETFVNNDVVASTAVTRVSAAVLAVKSAIEADGSTVFVVRKPQPRAIPPVPAGPKYVITSWLVSNKPARQSRRVRKVRPVYT